MKQDTQLREYFIWLFQITVWQAANVLMHNNIVFIGPIDVILALMELVQDSSSWASILSSPARISIGFLGVFILGILLGSLTYMFGLVKELLEPIMLLTRPVPMVFFVTLALIWVDSHNLSVFTSFLVVVPTIYVSTFSGLEHTDRKLLEMTRIFSMPLHKQVRYIYVPGLLPYPISGCRTALGISWKFDVAAEVIGILEGSIDEQFYYSKLYLNTTDLFAWTFVVVIVSALFEHLFLHLLEKVRH